MLPSLHDDFLVSYQVNCEARQIKLCAKSDTRSSAVNGEQKTRAIIFNAVEGYEFENDAFGNIIFALETVPVEQLIAKYGAQIAESHRFGGCPGPWADDLTSAAQALTAQGIKAFILSSSYGLSGWVLAKEALVEET
jgi:hypothetical protein